MNNKAIIEFGFRGGCYPTRPSAPVENTLLDLQNYSYPTQPHSIIAKYSSQKQNIVIPEMTSEANSSHSPLCLGRKHGKGQS